MILTDAQHDALYGHATTELSRGLTGSLLLSAEQQAWLAREARDAIDADYPQFAGLHRNSKAMRAYRASIRKRIHASNKRCGFVITTIILAAVLSWLIQRLLDHLFTESQT